MQMPKNPTQPTLVLAPMEGVTDSTMRRLLTATGGIDYCVAEFLRVSENPPPPHVVQRHIPECKTGWKTASGTPVIPQILGGDPKKLAITAELLAKMGAPSVDLNFGCPAKTVNRHDGGAALLRQPERIAGIIDAVRRAVAGHIPVTAKIRLGWEKPSEVFRIAQIVEDAGAERLTVHARTKVEGYSGKAHWDLLRELQLKVKVPLIANGDINSVEDFEECRALTGCGAFMIGRGAVQDPLIFLRIRGAKLLEENPIAFVTRFIEFSKTDPELEGFENGRIKQFVKFLAKRYPVMQTFFERIRTTRSVAEVLEIIPKTSFVDFDATPEMPRPTGPSVLQSA